MNLRDIDWQAGFDKGIAGTRWTLRALDKLKCADFIAPLALRLYLVPVLWMAGSKKFVNFTETAAWFGNEEWGLGLPLPYLLVFLVAFPFSCWARCSYWPASESD